MEFESLNSKRKYWENLFCSLVLLSFFLFSANSFSADSLSYSGRLVKGDGSPVAGPVDLKIDLSYTDFPNTILCSQNFSAVALSNGVFHLKLDLVCPGPPAKTVTEILTSVPATFSAALRVKDVTNNKTYAFQEIHSMPFATISETAKQLTQLGAVNGEVLKWNDTTKKWEPGIPGGGGTVTSVSGTLPISVATGSSTPVISMTEANTSTSGYLSSADWNTFNTKEGTIAGGTTLQYYRGDKSWQTLNTSVVPESGVTNLYFSNARVLGVPLDGFVAGPGVIVATDTVLQAFGKTQGQINLLTSDSANYLIKNGTDSITGTVTVASPTGFLRLIDPPAIFTDATNMAYVDSRDDLKVNKAGDTISGVLTLDSDLKIKGGANYVTLKGHATSAAYNLFLPQSAGTVGFVLSTDGSGNTTWINPASVANGTDTVTSASIVDGSIVDADINASAAIAQSKIANLSTDLAGKEPTVTNPSDITKYYRGDKSWQALNTTAVAEGSNLYFLNARVLGTDLLGLNTGVAGPIIAADTVLGAFGKLQYQVTDLKAKGQWDKNVNDIYYSTGNVGIGTTTPGSALDVKGTLRLSGSTSGYVGFAPAAVAGSTTYTLPVADGSAGQILKTNGVGVLSWVTDNSGAGAFSGTINRAVTTDGVGALSTSTTSATELGYVSGVTSSIQTQLNTKQSTTLPSTNFLVGNGSNVATAVAMSGDATLANTGAVTLKNTGSAGTYSSVTTDAQGRVTAGTNPVVVASITGTAPVTIGGTATAPVVAMAAATTAGNGYLTSTDWNTFNSKQAALSTGPTVNGIVYPANIGQTLQIPLAPATATDAVNKQYVDSFGQWGISAGNVYRTTGNVGIGTTTPSSALHISSGTYPPIRVERTTAVISATFANSLLMSTSTGDMVDGFGTHIDFGIRDTANVDNNIGRIGAVRSGADNTGSVVFHTANAGTVAEKMRIDNNGNVGIGTTSPGAKLDVVNTSNGLSFKAESKNDTTNGVQIRSQRSDGTAKLEVSSDSNGGFSIKTGEGALDDYSAMITSIYAKRGGNVGIGTTTPVAKLQVDAGDQFIKDPSDSVLRGIYFVPSDNSKRNSVAGFQTAATANDYVTLNSYYGSIRLTTGNPTAPTERVRVTNSGNVGIGTTAPGSALDVKGTLRLSGSTSGYVGFAPAAAAGATTYTLPTTQGTSGQVLSTNGVATTPTLSWVSVTSGTVTSVTSANADIAVATTTSTPVLTLNSGTGANQIVKLNGSSQLPAVNGSLLTSLNPANLSAAVSVAKGGTGLTAGTSGGIPYFNTTTTMASSALLGLNGIMLGGGAGAAPTTLGTGISGQFLKSAGASAPSWANLAIGDLKSSVAGDLFPGSGCGAAQTLVYSIVTDSFTCTNLPASATYWSAATGGINYASGNVGIGTTSPTTTLSFGGTAPAISQSTIDGTDNAVLKLSGGGTATSAQGAVIQLFGNEHATSPGQLYLASGATGNIYLNGNVGIGATTPLALIHGESSTTHAGMRLASPTSFNSYLDFFNNGVKKANVYWNGTTSTFQINDTGTTPTVINGAGGNVTIGTNTATSSSILFSSSVAAQGFIRLTSDANANYLQSGLDATVGSTKDFRFAPSYTTTPWMTIQGSTGNVGIGTSSPTNRLTIKATSNNVTDYPIQIHNLADTMRTGHGTYGMSNKLGTAQTIDYTYDIGGAQIFNTGGAERLRILGTGSVGIGIVNPVAPLHVFKDYTVASGGEEYGQYTNAQFSAASTNWKAGIRTNTQPTLTSGTLSKIVGVQSLISSGASGGTTTDAIALWGRVDTGAGQTLSNSYGVLLEDAGGTGAPVNLYGVYVRNLTKGTNQNFAVYTEGTTKSYFGGNVGVGTASPVAKLDVRGGTDPVAIRLTEESGSDSVWEFRAYNVGLVGGDNQFSIWGGLEGSTQTDRLVISKDGNVGIGITTPVSTLDVNGNVGTGPRITSFVDGANNAYWLAKGSSAEANRIGYGINADPVTGVVGSLGMRTNGATRLSIDNAGNVGIGTSTPSYTLHVAGTAGLSTGTAWTNASDIRLKDIHGDYEYGLNEVLKLHTVRYNYKKNNPLGLPSDFSKTGFIAQEVQKVIPDAVKKREDGYLEINVDPIHWAVVNSIKDLYSKYILPLWENDKKHERAIASLKESNENLKKEKDKEIASLKKEKDQEIAELKARLERIEKALKVK